MIAKVRAMTKAETEAYIEDLKVGLQNAKERVAHYKYCKENDPWLAQREKAKEQYKCWSTSVKVLKSQINDAKEHLASFS